MSDRRATGPAAARRRDRGWSRPAFGAPPIAPVLTCRIACATAGPDQHCLDFVLVVKREWKGCDMKQCRPADQRRPRRGARRSPARDQPDRGSGSHRGLGDLRRGPNERPPHWPGPACLPRRGPGRTWYARSCGRRRPKASRARRGRSGAGCRGPAPRLFRGRGGHRGGRRRRRDPPRPACRDRRRRQGQPRRVPGRADLLCAVVPDGVPPQDAAFATLASIPLHCAAPVRGRTGRQGRGARPRSDRPARGAAGDGVRLRRGRDRSRRVRQENRGRHGRAGPGRVR